MSNSATAEVSADEILDEVLGEKGDPASDSNSDTSNTTTTINRSSLQSYLNDYGVAIGDSDLAALTDQQAEFLWDWMELYPETGTDEQVEEWLSGVPEFLKLGEPEYGMRAMTLVREVGDAASTSETPAAADLTNNLPADDPAVKLAIAERFIAEIREASAKAKGLRSKLEDAESETKAAKAREKECLENLHAAEKELAAVIDDAKSGQQKLPFGDDLTAVSETASRSNEDLATVTASEKQPQQDWPLSDLGSKAIKKLVGADEFDRQKDEEDPIGLSESQLEKLEEKDITTICGLEKWINEHPFWHRDVKGFGEAAIMRLISTLAAFRRVNPMPAGE